MADQKQEVKKPTSGKPQAAPQAAAKKGFQQQTAVPAKFLKRKSREKPDFRGIVRVVGKDVDGHYTIRESLRKVKGVGSNLSANLSQIIDAKLGFSPDELIGNLSEEDNDKVEDVVRYPQKYGVKAFLLNRQKDMDSGENKHLVMTDLAFALRNDITRERDTRSYRGWRHAIGQKVRGQHTRTSGRTGMTVGVSRKAIKAQKTAAASSAQDKSAGKGKEEKK